MPWIVHDNRMMFVEDQQVFGTIDDALACAIGLLSTPAYAILIHAPASFRNGRAVPLRTLAGLAGYRNHGTIYRGIMELLRYGFVVTVPFGPNRYQYAGVPQVMRSATIQRLREVYQAA